MTVVLEMQDMPSQPGLMAYLWVDDSGETHVDYIDTTDPEEGLDIPEAAQ